MFEKLSLISICLLAILSAWHWLTSHFCFEFIVSSQPLPFNFLNEFLRSSERNFECIEPTTAEPRHSMMTSKFSWNGIAFICIAFLSLLISFFFSFKFVHLTERDSKRHQLIFLRKIRTKKASQTLYACIIELIYSFPPPKRIPKGRKSFKLHRVCVSASFISSHCCRSISSSSLGFPLFFFFHFHYVMYFIVCVQEEFHSTSMPNQTMLLNCRKWKKRIQWIRASIYTTHTEPLNVKRWQCYIVRTAIAIATAITASFFHSTGIWVLELAFVGKLFLHFHWKTSVCTRTRTVKWKRHRKGEYKRRVRKSSPEWARKRAREIHWKLSKA